METLMNFLIENYIYFAFVAVLLILALIGYIVDTTKTNKLKKEYAKIEAEKSDIPLAAFDSSVKIGETVNKMASKDASSVKEQPKNVPTNENNTPKINVNK